VRPPPTPRVRVRLSAAPSRNPAKAAPAPHDSPLASPPSVGTPFVILVARRNHRRFPLRLPPSSLSCAAGQTPGSREARVPAILCAAATSPPFPWSRLLRVVPPHPLRPRRGAATFCHCRRRPHPLEFSTGPREAPPLPIVRGHGTDSRDSAAIAWCPQPHLFLSMLSYHQDAEIDALLTLEVRRGVSYRRF
jgi:hypothetical protein